ncbi:hypothetical protein G7Y89_g11834 [Cudoniella acicularis]|uniref:NAD-dependent epimerase/dehydratase domain-containing protein n=1 Tax=Cudoniella acicularis TaxID=354080 RepID=A0A8H4W097_9HELO|nr:hypothetical protein G7Y89_g11834 [Cudoniella acicularis]
MELPSVKLVYFVFILQYLPEYFHSELFFIMAPRIFITGVSGYIGGQVLHDITAKHPGYQIRGLVRNEKQQEEITSKYPSVQTVVGTLDSTDILVEEAAQAAVVLQLADADHNSSILSLIRGLSQGSKTRTLIQLSGAASVIDVSSGLGKPTPKIWDDITDLHEISNFDHSHGHAVTDQLAVSAGKEHGVRTAIMIPPTVYGRGEGPIKNASMTIPWLVEAIKKRGKGFTIGEGKKHCQCDTYQRCLDRNLVFGRACTGT